MKYHDQALEQEFLNFFQPKIIEFAKLYMIISQSVAFFHFSFNFYQALKADKDSKRGDLLKISLVISLVLIVFCFLLYFLAKKYQLVAKHFSNIQVFFIILTTMEIVMIQ